MQKMIDVMQSFSLDFGRLFFAKHYQTHSIQNLHMKFLVIVNSALFTMMQYISRQDSMMNPDDLVHELTEMIVGYLQKKKLQNRSRYDRFTLIAPRGARLRRRA
jgi:hypothetical protein